MTRVVGVLPDVGAIAKVFDYVVPEAMEQDVRVGSLVRVELQGRRVGGWVVDDRREPVDGVRLKPIAKVTGWGPPPELVELSVWAAWRWAGPRAAFLGAASPPMAVRGLPVPPAPAPPATVVVDAAVTAVLDEAIDRRGGVLRLPPATDLAGVVAHVAARRGPILVVCPSLTAAGHVAARLRRQGTPTALLPRDWAAARAGGSTVVGARAAAWAPSPDAQAIVVLDGHDEAHQEERAPTWHAVDVCIERARRAGVPCLVTSPCPDLFLSRRPPYALARKDEREGWPIVDVLDRRGDDPRTGLYGERLVSLVRRAGKAVLVLNRKGRARLLACGACREVTRCERCGAAVAQEGDALACARCGSVRPKLCAECGSTALRALRVGVARAREELEALLGVPVGEVTGESGDVPDSDVLIGTEAVLHRVARADLVAFLDFDQELLAPRYRAAEEALALLARAGRLVGGRRGGGRVAVQTRLPHAGALVAALHGDPARLVDAERATRELLGFPPAVAMAAVSGSAAVELVQRLPPLVDVLGPAEGKWLVRAPNHATLCDALAAVERPPGRLRVAVDPRRL